MKNKNTTLSEQFQNLSFSLSFSLVLYLIYMISNGHIPLLTKIAIFNEKICNFFYNIAYSVHSVLYFMLYVVLSYSVHSVLYFMLYVVLSYSVHSVLYFMLCVVLSYSAMYSILNIV